MLALGAVPSGAGSTHRSAAWTCRLQAAALARSLSPSWSLPPARSSLPCCPCRPVDPRCHPAAEESVLRWGWVASASSRASSFSLATPVRAVSTAQKGSAQLLEPPEAALPGARGPLRRGCLPSLQPGPGHVEEGCSRAATGPWGLPAARGGLLWAEAQDSGTREALGKDLQMGQGSPSSSGRGLARPSTRRGTFGYL